MRWEWYSDKAFDPRPYWDERHGSPRARRLAERPPTGQAVWRYGFDEAGRVAAAQHFEGSLDGRQTSDETWRYADGEIERTCTSHDGTWLFTHHDRYEGDRIVGSDLSAPFGNSREEYSYAADGRLTHIDMWDNDRPAYRFEISHNERGELDRIVTTSLLGRLFTEVTYRRPGDRFSLDAQCQLVVDLLVARVPLVVAEAGVDKPADCVVLSYSDASCVPEIGIGLAEHRRQLAADGNVDQAWNLANFELRDIDWHDHRDATFVDETGLLDQELALAGEWHRIRGVLVDVARRLNRRDWSTVLSVTDDFRVCAVDDDLSHLARNLADSAP
jgi:hypothetical protein